MLKGRGRDPRALTSPTPARSAAQAPRPKLPSATQLTLRTPTFSRAPLAKPEPDYEVVEFPSEQYVNAKLQPPPPPPPRPQTGHPAEAASCGLCGGGGARVRCTECGRRALCASCDDMYHRHPKRRHHQRQALSLNQMRDERPPLPPKAAPPVPPPRRHKMSGDRMSASPRPPSVTDQRNPHPIHTQTMPLNRMSSPQGQQIPPHLQKLAASPAGHMGSMPYLPAVHHAPAQANTLGHLTGWGRPRGSLPGFNVPPNMMQPQMAPESWESAVNAAPQNWGRPLRRGASVLELGGGMVAGACTGCAGCATAGGWRYGSCASLDHQQWGAWPPQACCHPPMHPHAHPHAQMHASQTPQPYRRADSRAVSRAASRAGSRAASPAMSVRSRASRRTKHRTPSPPPLPSSDADSESESEDDRSRHDNRRHSDSHRRGSHNESERGRAHHERDRRGNVPESERGRSHEATNEAAAKQQENEEWLGPPPAAPTATWQCEHCTFVNEPGVRVCVVCCRTPTAAPKVVEARDNAKSNQRATDSPKSVADSARSIAESARGISRLDLQDDPPAPTRAVTSPSPVRVVETRAQNGQVTNRAVTKKERVSTGCGPSPPRENNTIETDRLETPTREQSVEPSQPRHDMGVGPSPPKETQHSISVGPSPPRQNNSVRASPYKEVKQPDPPARHSISVGPPSSPRENTSRSSSLQKKSAGTSPPRDAIESRSSSTSLRANVSNTGTSPPPQSISTQTYEVTNAWERAPSASRSRARRRFRDDSRRERSHSRHSLSSDTRESERSVRTSGGGGGRWEWRETRDSSPGAEWSGSERRRSARLTRRASHLDLRRDPRPPRRSSYYSQAASPEPSRALSMEALAIGGAAAERGLELARLMAEAERLGFSAAEVQAALAQSPAAPLAWLRERWPSLVAGVRAAAARLAPLARVSELDARAALARHRGAMWPAVTECVERYRRQTEQGTSAEGRVRGRVWGSPAGADDDAAPPPRERLRAEDSSSESDAPPPPKARDDDWMYLPLAAPRARARAERLDGWGAPADVADDIASDLRRLLGQARVPPTPDDPLPRGPLSGGAATRPAGDASDFESRSHLLDFFRSENDFIDAYNALARSSPLPSVDSRKKRSGGARPPADLHSKRDTYDVNENDSRSRESAANLNDRNNVRNHTSQEPIGSIDPSDRLPKNNNFDQTSIPIQSTDHRITLNDTMQRVQASHSSPPLRRNDTTSEEETTNSQLKSNDTMSALTEELTSNEQRNVTGSSTKHAQLVPNLPETSAISKLNQNDNKTLTSQVTAQNNTRNNSQAMQQALFERNASENETDMQFQEKSNNLNDIVDHTQRLIQQMKDEINSDINSIDSRNISQSEADSSSNESDISTEHESSYSDTENKETDEDEVSPNDSATSGDESEEDSHGAGQERRPTIIHRTSSEENDQFEEAMDHIEDQIEDFKNTNIEILDTIARSLQEEHTISIEMNEPKIYDMKGEDLNNNLFVEVNSFEEIYAELNSNGKQNVKQIMATNKPNGFATEQLKTAASDLPTFMKTNNKEVKQIFSDNESPVSQTNETPIENALKTNLPNQSGVLNNYITKHVIAPSSFKVMPPIKLIISENNQIALNAIIEDIEDNVDMNNEIQDITVLQITEEMTFENDLIITEAPATSTNILSQSSDEDESMSTADSDVTPTEQTGLIDNDDQTLENTPNSHINIKEDSENIEAITIEEPNAILDSNIENLQHKQQNHEGGEPLEIVDNDVQTNNDNAPHEILDNNAETNINEEEHEILNNDIQNNNEVIIEKSVSSEKTIKKPPNENRLNKTFNAIKSNIPKLVKVVQNNKHKGDKTSPKVIASKVPVRRGSVKQYPAPAPPKSHFGNIQSGHVKQLQTRLFNNKFPKTAVAVPSTIDAKPSTSTMHKKKPAPQPPTHSAKQPSPSKATPPKEKKNNFFRESCRTEDEWTESDPEDTAPVVRKQSEEPTRAPSPPPPVTLRRVSGKNIDLAKVQLPEGSPERQARMLLAEGATETWEQALIAVELVSRGTGAAAALLAALDCADLPAALAYLQQDCELCAERLPEHEMVSMLRCTHRCCRECARLYFTVQITERSIADCVCPYCKLPELESLPEDAWLEYFAHLDILLKTLLEADVHELFQRKLRDRTLARDPNFRWCMECSSGFFVHPKQKKIRCPECRSVSCAKCRKPWSVNHEGLTCEQYTAWLEDNDPERSIAAVQQHLRENGLECPRCHFKYSLSRGGCMHFTCTQCKYEFCYGCGKPFMMGARCGLSEYCAKLGLHAHHPRNCLFYLRDKEPHELQTLLQMNNVPYETEAPEGSTNRCPIQLQRETPTGLVDGTCGGDVPPNYAGLCKNHYLEYLSRAVVRARLDPLPLLDVEDLETLVRRAALRPPPRPYGSLDGLYKRALLQIVKEKIPLDG